jgi:hypothetical protein
MSDFEYAQYNYESELRDIEKALVEVDKLIMDLRLNTLTELHLSQQLWAVLDSIEESLGVET